MARSTKNMVIADTGFWFALGNPKDRHHARALAVSQGLQEDPVTTWPVIIETGYLLQKTLGVAAVTRFLDSLHQAEVDIFGLEYRHFPRVQRLIVQYADLPMDLADASLVLLAEELGHGRILSTDRRDFQAYRWKNRYPFTNLLFPED